jgi:hypothetical protein
MHIAGVKSGPRVIASTYKPTQTNYTTTMPNTVAQIEIDNHADTTCFGSNFTAIEFTGDMCEVSPFSNEYQTMTNIPVATAATAWDDPISGETIILLFNQGLWFGDNLQNSLINPNQCRAHGIEINDNPFDQRGQPLSIKDEITGIEVPMQFHNSIIYARTRAPTLEEIKTNPTVELTSDAPWDPSKVGQPPLSREEEEKRSIVASIKVDANTVSTIRPREPQLKSNEAEFDILMASCSAVHSERTMVQRLISMVQIASYYEDDDPQDAEMAESREVTGCCGTKQRDLHRSRDVARIDTRARHTELTAEEVSQKFGIPKMRRWLSHGK